MATNLEPIVGNWYQNLDDDVIFEVVAVDEDEGLVEIQHEDGDLDQVDLDEWDQWELEAVAEPEDWTKPMDEETDDEDSLDHLNPGDDTEPESWAKPAPRAVDKRSHQAQDEDQDENDWSDVDDEL